MPSSVNIHAYPHEFHDLAERGHLIKNAFSVTFPTEKDARAYRMRWYAFIRALDLMASKEEVHEELDPLGGDVPIQSWSYRDRARQARAFVVKVEGPELTFMPRELSQEGKMSVSMWEEACKANRELDPDIHDYFMAQKDGHT